MKHACARGRPTMGAMKRAQCSVGALPRSWYHLACCLHASVWVTVRSSLLNHCCRDRQEELEHDPIEEEDGVLHEERFMRNPSKRFALEHHSSLQEVRTTLGHIWRRQPLLKARSYQSTSSSCFFAALTSTRPPVLGSMRQGWPPG